MGKPSLKTALVCLPFVVLAVFLSVRFLDTWTARHVMKLLGLSNFLKDTTSDIPDLLALSVCAITGVFWGRYILLRRREVFNEEMQCCMIAGVAVPLAFFLKWPLKFAFGRLNARVWLVSHVSDKFHWFQKGEHLDGFPSGHMMVFTAFFTAIWLFYPRWRPLSLALTLLLAVALIATDYHFISEVIAGAYLGLTITLLTASFFNSLKKSAER